jgi:hypothetical protein
MRFLRFPLLPAVITGTALSDRSAVSPGLDGFARTPSLSGAETRNVTREMRLTVMTVRLNFSIHSSRNGCIYLDSRTSQEMCSVYLRNGSH